ncbi:MAG: hypothetical protein JWN99_640, partial [Ilumatobacteraceae bacterium]|nr:hypothetical protein [Ilumatobacteraceae bacterium]
MRAANVFVTALAVIVGTQFGVPSVAVAATTGPAP